MNNKNLTDEEEIKQAIAKGEYVMKGIYIVNFVTQIFAHIHHLIVEN